MNELRALKMNYKLTWAHLENMNKENWIGMAP